ncbi:hypothetical protein [Catellatospora tritici]|nr:hypothetical protein [Catellatospora tritici]MBV1856141.1 hypothetical protein [Catellatospora tritici]
MISAAAAGSTLLGVAPAHAAVTTSTVCDEVIEVQEASWDVYTGCVVR